MEGSTEIRRGAEAKVLVERRKKVTYPKTSQLFQYSFILGCKEHFETLALLRIGLVCIRIRQVHTVFVFLRNRPVIVGIETCEFNILSWG